MPSRLSPSFSFKINAKPLTQPTFASHAAHRRRSISRIPTSKFHHIHNHTLLSDTPSHLRTSSNTAKMAPSNLPPIFNATSQDIEMLLAAQCHIGSKNMQVHMEPYLWKTRPDGVNIINIGKTWYVSPLLHIHITSLT
jgi:small subunit ribosomal protein SAe